MPRNYVDIAFLTADSVQLRDVTSFEITTAHENAEPVPTMNPQRRALGYKSGQRTVSITIESRVANPREFDWREYERTQTPFLLAYQEQESGNIYHAVDTKVTEVATSHGEDGESIDRVTLVSLDHFQRP